jgi:hypothetical protein
MHSITKKLKKMAESKKDQKIIFRQTNIKRVGLFVDDLSTK